MKLQGKIKTIIFKGERVSVLLEDARIFTDAQKWEEYTDIELVKDGEYKKGETWLSSFKKHIYQACEELKKMGKGIEVDVEVIVGKAGFKNIEKIALAVPEVDVNKDLLPPDTPETEESMFPEEERAEDSPEAEIEKLVESTAVDKDTLIIRQTCLKAIGSAIQVDKDADWKATGAWIVALAKMLEDYVLGK